jgi:hypothetical protein
MPILLIFLLGLGFGLFLAVVFNLLSNILVGGYDD